LRSIERVEVSDSETQKSEQRSGFAAGSWAGLLIRRSLVRAQVGEPKKTGCSTRPWRSFATEAFVFRKARTTRPQAGIGIGIGIGIGTFVKTTPG